MQFVCMPAKPPFFREMAAALPVTRRFPRQAGAFPRALLPSGVTRRAGLPRQGAFFLSAWSHPRGFDWRSSRSRRSGWTSNRGQWRSGRRPWSPGGEKHAAPSIRERAGGMLPRAAGVLRVTLLVPGMCFMSGMLFMLMFAGFMR